MLSNQMRGRAIRIDRNHPDKGSNIWHLATCDARFEGNEAPSYFGRHEIVSGIERVLMPNPLGVPETNLPLAKNRDLTRRWWQDSLFTGYGNTPPIGLSTGVQADSLTVKTLRYTGYLYYLFALLPVVLFLFYLPGPVRVIGLTVIALLVAVIAISYTSGTLKAGESC